jgi:hypothetical protein
MDVRAREVGPFGSSNLGRFILGLRAGTFRAETKPNESKNGTIIERNANFFQKE